MPRKLNTFSSRITQPKSQGGSQAMLRAIGLSAEDLDKPQIGIASMWWEGNPCNMHLDELAPLAERTDLCLVWLDTGSTVFYEPDELESVVHLDEVDQDGFTTIYEVSPRR